MGAQVGGASGGRQTEFGCLLPRVRNSWSTFSLTLRPLNAFNAAASSVDSPSVSSRIRHRDVIPKNLLCSGPTSRKYKANEASDFLTYCSILNRSSLKNADQKDQRDTTAIDDNFRTISLFINSE